MTTVIADPADAVDDAGVAAYGPPSHPAALAYIRNEGALRDGKVTMQLQVSGKQIDVGGALRAHVEKRLNSGVGKYFDRAIDAHVVFSREAHQFRADCTVHVGHGISASSDAAGGDAYGAFDAAAARLEKQLRRTKRRLRNHHQESNGADGA